MTELTITEDRETETESQSTCPPWCVTEGNGTGVHTHSSADTRVETLGHPVTVQLVQVAETEPRMLLDGQVASIEQAHRFATAIKRLADAGTMAEPGLAFVAKLAAGSQITLEQMALASGIELGRIRKQKAGGRLMTLHEVDQLALAVANLAATRAAS